MEELKKAIREVETETGKSLLRHAVKTAFENDGVLIAIMRKIIPDLRAQELRTSKDDGPVKITVIDTD